MDQNFKSKGGMVTNEFENGYQELSTIKMMEGDIVFTAKEIIFEKQSRVVCMRISNDQAKDLVKHLNSSINYEQKEWNS